MAFVLPILVEMAANASFVAGLILGVRLTIFTYKFLKRGL